MIGKLKGRLTEVDGAQGFIETSSGVSYRVYLTPRVISQSVPDDQIEVYTYLQVREDDLSLYGFESNKQYQLFTMLLSVDKVGPKLAFTIISNASIESIYDAVSRGDPHFFSRIPGIGTKTAQKILLEMSSKMGSNFDIRTAQLSTEDNTVVDALVTLGFIRRDAIETVARIDKAITVEEKITEAIKQLAKH